MSEVKHTPKGWRVSYQQFSKVVTEDGELVATCARVDSLVALQARARMIAAAPELFAIAKRLAVIGDGLNNGSSAAEAEVSRLVDLAIAAVKKATTGSQQ
jgi:hypothetical protein